MNKLDCILDYCCGTKAYYLFWFGTYFNNPEIKEYILEKRHLIGARVSIISNIMLGIKEDLVENKGDRVYESKLFLNSLEKSVEYLATKVSNGYKIGSYVFPDAETLVAIVRNKLAHGNYVIDFEHGRVIINHQGTDIILSLYKLSIFIVSAFQKMIKEEKTMRYVRDMVYFERKDVATREKGLKDVSEVRQVIKGYNYLYFAIESLNGSSISRDCIILFENFMKHVKLHPLDYKKSESYRKLCDYLAKRNCRLVTDYKRLTNRQDIDDIIGLLGDEIFDNTSLNYSRQLDTIGYEVHRKFNPKLNNFNPLGANIKHLILLDGMSKKNSVDMGALGCFVSEVIGNNEMRFYYDEYGMALISMFNSFFMYPMDDVYSIPGEYTLDRKEGLDFASLDLSMINPTVISVDDSPLINAKTKLDSLITKIAEVNNKISQQQQNLSKVQGKADVVARITNGINALNQSLSILSTELVIADSAYNAIKNDFSMNGNYFRNKAIIEGIRNSIAHGHYEIVVNGDFMDTMIIFNDIYEGKLTFQAKISFRDFEKLINDNTEVIHKFINKKMGVSSGNTLVRK